MNEVWRKPDRKEACKKTYFMGCFSFWGGCYICWGEFVERGFWLACGNASMTWGKLQKLNRKSLLEVSYFIYIYIKKCWQETKNERIRIKKKGRHGERWAHGFAKTVFQTFFLLLHFNHGLLQMVANIPPFPKIIIIIGQYTKALLRSLKTYKHTQLIEAPSFCNFPLSWQFSRPSPKKLWRIWGPIQVMSTTA